MSRLRQDVTNDTVLETMLKHEDLAGILETKLPLFEWRNLSSVTKTIRRTMVHSKVKHFPSPDKPYSVIDGKLTLEDKFRPLEPLEVIEPDSSYNVQSIDIHPNKMCLFCKTLKLGYCRDIKFVNGMLYLDDTINIINNLDLSLDAVKNLMFNAINTASKNKRKIVARFFKDYYRKHKHVFLANIHFPSIHRPYTVVFGGLFWDHFNTHPPQTWTPEPDETVQFIFSNAIKKGSIVRSIDLSGFENLVSIFENAFDELEINELILPENLVFIKSGAFKNAQLTSIRIPDTVESIGEGAFENSPLNALVLGAHLQSIGAHAFKNARLANLVIPDTVKSIGESAFLDSPLISLVLGENLQSIGNAAFGRAQLQTLVIPNSVQDIGWGAFFGSRLHKLDLSETKITYLGKKVFYSSLLDDDGVEQPLKLPLNLQEIGKEAFYCAILTQLVIPNTVKKIGFGAFYDSTLRKLDLSQTEITNIGPSAFYHSLLDAAGDDPALLLPPQLEKIGQFAFYNAKLKKINRNHKFPSTVKEIGEQAFINSLLEKLDLSETQLEQIKYKTFAESPLKVLKLPNSKLTVIQPKAFEKAQLTILTIPNNVTFIGEGAFANSPLQYLFFGQRSRLRTIDVSAFEQARLTKLTIPNTVKYIAENNFEKSNLREEASRKRLRMIAGQSTWLRV